MKISTKTGDDATTSLMFGRRVSKACARVRAYGAVDELSANLAMARALAGGGGLAQKILRIQQSLVALMAELATDAADFPKLAEKNVKLLGDAELGEIEAEIEAFEAGGKTFAGWTHAGDTPLDAALDIARAKCRAAEREIAALNQGQPLPRNFPLVYINRLSDLLYLYSLNAKQAR